MKQHFINNLIKAVIIVVILSFNGALSQSSFDSIYTKKDNIYIKSKDTYYNHCRCFCTKKSIKVKVYGLPANSDLKNIDLKMIISDSTFNVVDYKSFRSQLKFGDESFNRIKIKTYAPTSIVKIRKNYIVLKHLLRYKNSTNYSEAGYQYDLSKGHYFLQIIIITEHHRYFSNLINLIVE